MIFKSRHTPNVKINETKIEIGETVTYRLQNGNVVDVEIKSEPMTHARCATYGYEGVFSDDGQLGFADNAKIESIK